MEVCLRCRCFCVHLFKFTVAMATVYWVTLCRDVGSWPSWGCTCTMQLFCLTGTCVSSQLSLWQPYPRDLHLKLESSCPWIILSWDRFLEYPGQTYPEGDTEKRNGAGCHFWDGLMPILNFVRNLGSGLGRTVYASVWICRCFNPPILHIYFRFKIRIQVRSEVKG